MSEDIFSHSAKTTNKHIRMLPFFDMRCALLDTQYLTFIYKYIYVYSCSNGSPWNIASLNIFVRVLIVFCDLFCSINENENLRNVAKNATILFDEMTTKTLAGTKREERYYGRMTFVTNWFRQKHLKRNASSDARIFIKWYCEYWVCHTVPHRARAWRFNELREY